MGAKLEAEKTSIRNRRLEWETLAARGRKAEVDFDLENYHDLEEIGRYLHQLEGELTILLPSN